jgi:hypothetical protein
MTTASDYLQAAAECRRTASIQKTLEQQEAWLMMAEAYERVANKHSAREDQAQESAAPKESGEPGRPPEIGE